MNRALPEPNELEEMEYDDRQKWQVRWNRAKRGTPEYNDLKEMAWTGMYVPEPGEQSIPRNSYQPTIPSDSRDPKLLPKPRHSYFPSPPGKGIAFTGTRKNVPVLTAKGRRTRKNTQGGEIVSVLFNIRDQVKLYHWQTRSFAEHKATDDLIGTLDTNIDKFVESYMGLYGRPHVRKTLPVKNLTVSGIRKFISRSTQWLSTSLPRKVKKTDSDLLNIRDEILSDLNQVKYLFTLS
jgi:hypothetical protein